MIGVRGKEENARKMKETIYWRRNRKQGQVENGTAGLEETVWGSDA